MDQLSCKVVGRCGGGGGCMDQLSCKVVGRWGGGGVAWISYLVR